MSANSKAVALPARSFQFSTEKSLPSANGWRLGGKCSAVRFAASISRPLEPAAFSSDATVHQLPGLGVLFAASGAVDLRHTRELIVDGDLSIMAAPTCRSIASQLGRTVELEPGASVLMSNAEVGSIRLAAASRFITFRVPRAAMASLVLDLDAAVARRIPADNTALKLLVDYLESVRDTRALATRNCSGPRSHTPMICWPWRSAPPATRPKSPTAAACAQPGWAPQELHRAPNQHATICR